MVARTAPWSACLQEITAAWRHGPAAPKNKNVPCAEEMRMERQFTGEGLLRREMPFESRKAERGSSRNGPGATSSTAPDFELIVRKPLESFRWNVHGYPHLLAKWHYHPEYELH